MKMTYSGRNTL